VANHQHGADRLTHPLKRVGGGFERISWIRPPPRSPKDFAGSLMNTDLVACLHGRWGQGCHFEAAFGVRLLALWLLLHYSPLAQELTGEFWVQAEFSASNTCLPARTRKRRTCFWPWMEPDDEHQMPRPDE